MANMAIGMCLAVLTMFVIVIAMYLEHQFDDLHYSLEELHTKIDDLTKGPTT